ncbi:ArnT family glycosyltransferase [Robertkochia solimangrovi]|uniref:ArnT family glycosyltransferase n=1 Tax=Robertkochia solimangrovi TaxID=2213046 RepID=UPI00117DB976|nr:glycosyltransferase family 39 protein [Robertkochia solimangrovi]TRZ46293.1 hypothetical protein DMZ48_03295 [Robertkochia solimangrovi]
MDKKSNRLLYIFLTILTLINLIQSGITELIFDEAYYWYLSTEIDWGFFDHPPFIPAMIHLGVQLFDSELGVRFFAPFMHSASILLLWHLIDHPKKHRYLAHFIILVSSIGLFSAYGFLMLPDTGLLFFAILYLYAYRKFTMSPNLIAMLLLAISMTGILYSKYHGVLFITLTIFANLRILKHYRFWLACGIALALCTPHLMWLINNDFVSVKYHLIDRANSHYRISFTLNYLLNALAVAGLAFPLLYYAFIKGRMRTPLERALKWIGYGFLIFFLLSSFNRKTQAQWLSLIIPSLLYFGFIFLTYDEKFRKWLFKLNIAAVVILCYARLALFIPTLSPIPYESHGNKAWVKNLSEQAGELPVVFHNSYRDAAMYAFYSRNKVFSMNDVGFRQNQFDFNHAADSLRHHRVVIMTETDLQHYDITYHRPFKNATWKGWITDDFQYYGDLKIKVDENDFTEGIPENFSVSIFNPYPEDIPLKKLKIQGVTFDSNRKIMDTFALKNKVEREFIPRTDSIVIKIRTKASNFSPEVNYFRPGLVHYNFNSGFEGNLVKVNTFE